MYIISPEPSITVPIVGQAEQTNIKVSPSDGGLGSIGELTAYVVLIAACGFVLREAVKGWSKWMESSIHAAAENQKMIMENSKNDQELLRTVFIQQNDRVVYAIEKQTDAVSRLNDRMENFMQVIWVNEKSLVKQRNGRDSESAQAK